jgi:hypothetical protein
MRHCLMTGREAAGERAAIEARLVAIDKVLEALLQVKMAATEWRIEVSPPHGRVTARLCLPRDRRASDRWRRRKV